MLGNTATNGDDTLSGTSQGELLHGLDGNDLLQGLSGDDVIYGDAGLDHLHGGKGNDWMFGGDGDDKLFGEIGADLLRGDAGHDVIKGGDGNDTITGGDGGDALFGGAGADLFRYPTLADSRVGGLDIIYDFEHGIDKIDLPVGYTGITSGHASATELRIAYSAASDRTYLRDDHSDFEIALKGDYRGILNSDDFLFHVPPPPSVGYYEASFGSGYSFPWYGAPSTHLGYNAVNVETLESGVLNQLKALLIVNRSESSYSLELLTSRPALADYVANGGVLIIQDRDVGEAARILPGLSGETMVADRSGDVNFVNDHGAAAEGPGGTLNDASLDGGNPSSFGYARDSSLRSDVVRVQTTGNADHVVSFAYAYGQGAVYYSSIPMDIYLAPTDTLDDLTLAMRAYMENLISWAVADHHDLLAF